MSHFSIEMLAGLVGVGVAAATAFINKTLRLNGTARYVVAWILSVVTGVGLAMLTNGVSIFTTSVGVSVIFTAANLTFNVVKRAIDADENS